MNPTVSTTEGIEELFALYADDIYRYARYSAPSSVDAKDVVQEVFLRAFRSWGTFRQESNSKTWLFQIARNYIFDLLRKKRTEIEYQEKHKPDLSDVSVPLDTLLELEDAVSHLKPDHRQVFVLRCVQDLTIEETSAILGWSQSKVKTTLHRAIRELRQSLGDATEFNSSMKVGEEHEYRGGNSPSILSTRRSENERRR